MNTNKLFIFPIAYAAGLIIGFLTGSIGMTIQQSYSYQNQVAQQHTSITQKSIHSRT